MKSALCVIITIFALYSCGNQSDTSKQRTKYSANQLYSMLDSALIHQEQYPDTVTIRYAKGLQVCYKQDGIHVTISNPDPKATHTRPQEIVITQPSRRFICTTALQLGNFEALGLEDKIVGMNSLRNLFSPVMQQQIEDGRTVAIGKEGNFDLEMVIACRPDYIFVSASKHGGFEALKDCGIPLLLHHGYKETDPLGQAEWIKLIGLLTGEVQRANAVFDDIESHYLALRDEVKNYMQTHPEKKIPTIASGRQMRDGWYIVGGRSYMARIFADAGADYIMKDNKESGGVSLEYESVYARAVHADFWQTDDGHHGDFSLDDLAAEDQRYTTMKAYKDKHVIFCNLAKTPYRELAGVQPHLLLADFVKALHPDILPDYTPHYYTLLK